jgi:NADH:ubiquinone oxidoreductase subunit 5 (subunit L)/multisubunit Na+/H+ antiporter MnhA subunit
MVMNRIADLAFTVGIVAVFYSFQTLAFSNIFGLAPFVIRDNLFF